MIKQFSFVFILFTFCAFAQDKAVSYAFNANYGTSITPSAAANGQGQHVGLGLTYMDDNLFGIKNDHELGLKFGLDYDEYHFGEKALGNTTNFMRGSVELVCNISNVITPRRFRVNENFNFIAHAGVGLGVNRSMISNGTGLESDEFTGSNDKIGHLILGFSPRYYFTKDISINIDGSAFLNFKQQINSDGTPRDGSKSNFMFTLGAGLIYTFNS